MSIYHYTAYSLLDIVTYFYILSLTISGENFVSTCWYIFQLDNTIHLKSDAGICTTFPQNLQYLDISWGEGRRLFLTSLRLMARMTGVDREFKFNLYFPILYSGL